MPSFPDSVWAPASKSAGQTIQAAHVNDVQDEVVAIEGGYRNGTAPLNSSGSTFVTLSVSGNSTVAALNAGNSTLANLSVTSNSTIANAQITNCTVTNLTASFGGVTTFSSGAIVSTGIVRQNSVPAWNVFSSAALAVATGSTGAGVAFDGQTFVRGTVEHSTASNSSRVTVNTTGLYDITYHGAAHTAAGARLRVQIVFNDSTRELIFNAAGGTADAPEDLNCNGKFRVDATGYFTVQLGSSNAGSTHGGAAAGNAARFMGHFIG